MSYDVHTIGAVITRTPVALASSSPERDQARIAAMGGIGACKACERGAGAMGVIPIGPREVYTGVAVAAVLGVAAGAYAYSRTGSVPITALATFGPAGLAQVLLALAIGTGIARPSI